MFFASLRQKQQCHAEIEPQISWSRSTDSAIEYSMTLELKKLKNWATDSKISNLIATYQITPLNLMT